MYATGHEEYMVDDDVQLSFNPFGPLDEGQELGNLWGLLTRSTGSGEMMAVISCSRFLFQNYNHRIVQAFFQSGVVRCIFDNQLGTSVAQGG